MEPLTRVTLARLLNITPATVTSILAKNGWTPQRRRAKKQTLTESQVLCVLRNFFVIEKDETQQPKIRDDGTVKSCYVRTDDGRYLLQVYSDTVFPNCGFALSNEDEAREGGLGIADSWTVVPDSEVPTKTKRALEWARQEIIRLDQARRIEKQHEQSQAK